jgi:hypothetical protein
MGESAERMCGSESIVRSWLVFEQDRHPSANMPWEKWWPPHGSISSCKRGGQVFHGPPRAFARSDWVGLAGGADLGFAPRKKSHHCIVWLFVVVHVGSSLLQAVAFIH